MPKNRSNNDSKDVMTPEWHQQMPNAFGEQDQTIIEDHSFFRFKSDHPVQNAPPASYHPQCFRAGSIAPYSTKEIRRSHHHIDSAMSAINAETGTFGSSYNDAAEEFQFDLDNIFDITCGDDVHVESSEGTYNGSHPPPSNHIDLASQLSGHGFMVSSSPDHRTSRHHWRGEYPYISPESVQYYPSFEQHHAQQPYPYTRPDTRSYANAIDDGSTHPRLPRDHEWSCSQPTAFTEIEQQRQLLSRSDAIGIGHFDMQQNLLLLKDSKLPSDLAWQGYHGTNTTAESTTKPLLDGPSDLAEPRQSTVSRGIPSSPPRAPRVSGQKNTCTEGNCRRGVKTPGSFCKRHQDKYDRNHAKPPEIPFLEQMNFTRVRQMAFPNYPKILPDDQDRSLPRSGQEQLWEHNWVIKFLDAAMKPVDTNHPNTTKFEREQQEKFNGKACMERKEGGRYSNEWINARMRMLFRTVLALHCGGPAIYPIGGDNGGYGKPDTSLNFEQRLTTLCASMEENKLIVMNVIEGRGVVALAENPERFHKRKTQNKQSNQKKDEVLEAERKRQRSTAEQNDELSEDEEEGEIDGADDEAYEPRPSPAARPNTTGHGKRQAPIDMPSKSQVRRSKRVKRETPATTINQILGGLPQGAPDSSLAMSRPSYEHSSAQARHDEDGPLYPIDHQSDPYEAHPLQHPAANVHNQHLDTSLLYDETQDLKDMSEVEAAESMFIQFPEHDDAAEFP